MEFTNFETSLKKNNQKCANYRDTIDRIQKILNNLLKGTDYRIFHKIYTHKKKKFFTVESEISLNKTLVIKQYGKGLSLEQAQASSYAEIIERMGLLQNFFSHNPLKSTLTYHFSQENEIPEEDLLLNRLFFTQVKKNNPYLINWPRVKWVKVYDIFNDKFRFLHYRFLHNYGTASGNTYEEAFVQSLCEVFERYCVGTILLNQVKCPTIEKGFFNEKNKQLLKLLEKDGSRFKIKDLSFNKGFPTIGLLRSSNDNSLHLQVGSATSMDMALERCLTELFQVSELENKEFVYKKRIEKIYETFPNLNDLMPKKALYVLNYPKNAFISDDLLKILLDDAGYFTPWDYEDPDCGIEVRNLLNLLKDNEFHIYMLDYSWLNFPTLHIIVPELHLGYNEILYESCDLIDFKKKILCNFDKLTKEDLKILNKPQTIINIIQKPLLNMFFSIDLPSLRLISTWFFIGKLAKAFDLISIAEKYLSQAPIDQLLLCLDKTPEAILNFLTNLLPPCGKKQCNECKKKDCRYFATKPIQQRIIKSYPTYFGLHKKYLSK